MPIFLASLLGGFVSLAGSMVGRVLIALGIGYVSYTGVDTALTAIKSSIWGHMTDTGTTVLGLMALLKVDVQVNILFSALAARLVLQGLTSGKLTRMVIK